MSLSPGFADFAAELLSGLGPMSIRRMFGGAMLTRDGANFAILDDDVIFLKADPAFAAELKAQGSSPWHYLLKKDGTPRDIAYWSMPETAADDPDEATGLARRAVAVAVADKAGKAKKTVKLRKAAKPKAKK